MKEWKFAMLASAGAMFLGFGLRHDFSVAIGPLLGISLRIGCVLGGLLCSGVALRMLLQATWPPKRCEEELLRERD